MAHFAKIVDNIVTEVIVAEQDFIDSGAVGDPSQWKQTSYNTQGNVHRLGGEPLRKNFAGVGYLYVPEIDGFVPPKPFISWVLDEESGAWNPPFEKPNDGKNYIWNEESLNWIETPSVLPNGE